MNQSNQPLVSVVITCYNHEKFVQDSIQSVIDQTYQNIELIIIDDGSKDGSVEKIKEMLPACQERFIRFEFRHRPNKGLSETLNEALEWCEGEYYSAIASDDMMLPEKIIIQINYMIKNKKCNALFGGYKLIDNFNFVISDQKKENKIYLTKHYHATSKEFMKLNLIYRCFLIFILILCNCKTFSQKNKTALLKINSHTI